MDRINIRGRSNSGGRGSPSRSRGKSVKRLKSKFMHKIGAKKITTSLSSQESYDGDSGDNSSSRIEGSNHDVDVEKTSHTSENNDEAMKIPTTPHRAALTAPMLAKFTSTNSSLSLSPLRLRIFQNSLHQNPSSDSGKASDVIKQSFESNKDADDMNEMIIEQIDSNEDNVATNHHGDGSDLQREGSSEEASTNSNRSSNKTAELHNRTRCRSDHDTSRSPSNIKHVKLLHRQAPSSSSRRHRHRRNHKIQQQCNQMDNKTSLSYEYNVDHSCSTPLERLARDVGNTLRQWDVHQGCDRHVSLDWMGKLASTSSAADENALGQTEADAQSLMSDVTEPDESSSTANDDDAAAVAEKEEEMQLFNPVMSMDMCERGFANRSRRINVWMGDEDNIDDELPNKITAAAPLPQLPQASLENVVTPNSVFPSSESDKGKNPGRDSNYNGAQCIRSKKISFQTVGFSPEITDDDPMTWKRRRYTIPLVLSLWDGPHIPAITEQPSDEIVDDDTEEADDGDEVNSIPLSLRPDPSPSSFSLLGELGILSSCGTQRSFFNDTNLMTSKSVAFDKSRSPLRTGFGQDLSSLFNIGQHITLCLDTENSEDIQSLYNDMYAYIEDQIRLANKSHRATLKERACRWKKQQRSKMQKEIDLDKEEVIDFESDIQMQKISPSPFDDDNSDTTNRILDAESDSFDEDMNLDGSDSIEDDSVYMEDHIRLNQQEMNNEVISALRSILQTAVSLAAVENDCNIPVFGVWGLYSGGSIDGSSNKKRGSVMFEGGRCAAPTWIVPSTPQDQKMTNYDEESKLFLSSPIIVGTCETSTFRSTHRVYSIADQNNLPTHLSTLDGLAKVMLGQCPSHRNEKVALIAARHCYCWKRNEVYMHNETYQEWRKAGQNNTGTASELEVYREQCQNQALKCLERASANSRGFFWRQTSPLWGPSEGNPLFSLSASVSWGSIRTESPRQKTVVDSTAASVPTPLLQLPLKRRSAIAPSPAELFEMDYALQSAALNPIGVGLNDQSAGDPREPIFFASATFDNNSPCATLSANTRCVLAALIRCGTLGLETLPGHLTKTGVLHTFSPRKRKNSNMSSAEVEEVEIPESETKLREAIKLANVGSVTERLVDALDWRDTKIVSSGSEFHIESTSYPDPPDEATFLNKNANSNMPVFLNHRSEAKAAPPGRLLSILFAHMAKLRTPPSMMKLWLSFVEDLRTRWDRNETLPNLGFIPGLDIDDNDKRQAHSHWRINQSDVHVLGHRADLAAFVNSSEPDPLREFCLINQKLQVFNICMECKLYTEYLFEKKMKQEQRHGSGSDDSSDGEDFYDAPMEYLSVDEKESFNFEQMLRQRAALSTATKQSRVGARCPVPYAMPLIESGDQVYAPYLQRTTPITDEEEVKNKQMLGLDRGAEDDPLSIHDRITIAQRLQKPKLLSDMSSFKAANKGAVFEDFVRWYGNPEHPLGEELNEESLKRKDEIRSKLSPEQLKTFALKEASEAISILMNLRAFWEDTWDEAEAEAAFEQDPLFNPYITVEMMLHSLETIHPALLMNQVLAVNLSNARFVLKAASNQARQVPILAEGFRKLHNAIDLALQALTKDSSVEVAASKPGGKADILSHLATETIAKCEEACNQIGEFEILLSRSLALLEKLPGKYGLIDSLLQEGCTDSKFVFVKDPSDRDAFLGAIRSGQMINVTIDPSSFFPDASMREYVLSNNDRLNPCQLNARLVPSTRGIASSFNGSLLLAISSSEHS